ncbi:MAG: DUF5709 domain-containing protein [Pseudonocardiales bacterium]|jgi:hypothetical protein|nr:DUF5709 domain-containing protein [Pseudonocardiales bacterium]
MGDRDEIDDDVYEQLDAADTLVTGGPADPLDEGWSPPERARGLDDWGVTAGEVAGHESLTARLARELPDVAPERGDGLGDAEDTDGELLDDQVGTRRAGRLYGPDADVWGGDQALYGQDVGVDGAGASAEEAAVHLVEVEDDVQR